MSACRRAWNDLNSNDEDFSLDEWKQHEHSDPDDPVLGHHDEVCGTNCDGIAAKWWEWAFQTPAELHPNIVSPENSYRNSFPNVRNPIRINDCHVFMVAFLPYKLMQDNLITLNIHTKRSKYVFLPIITAEACTQEFPSLTTEQELWDLINNDAHQTTYASLCIDGIKRIGCYVESQNRVLIKDVANDNFMGIRQERLINNATVENGVEIVHHLLAALVDVERLGNGGHEIRIEGRAKNYFNAVTISLNILA